MANVENEELRASLCNICDWRSSSCEDQAPSSVNNLEKRKVALLARALREKLPGKYRHVICKPQPNEYTEPDVCVLRTNCKSKEEVDSWVSMYSDHSGFKWDLQPRPVSFNRKVKELHRCKYVCHEPIFGQTAPDKKTVVQQCPASISVVVKSGKTGETDEHINSFPTVVRLRGDHSCYTGRSLKGDIGCNSSRQRPESEIQKKTVSLSKEGKTEVTKESKAKKDPHIATRNHETLTLGKTSHNAKKTTELPVKKEPPITSKNIIDIEVTTKVDALSQDEKVATNSSLVLSKENTSQRLVKGATANKETQAKKAFDAVKARITHGKVNGHTHTRDNDKTKKPLILIKANRISALNKITKTCNLKTEDHTEEKSTTMLVKIYRNPEEKTTAAVVKVAIPAATKRNHEDTNGQNTKSKKARVEERKSCDKHFRRTESVMKLSPKKTLYEEKAIPVAHTMECTPLTAEEEKVLKGYTPIQQELPVKAVAIEPVKPQHVPLVDKFAELYRKFDALFAVNHEPATALATHIVDLQLREGGNWRNFACPDIHWCQSLFDKVVREPLIATPQTTFAALTELAALCGAADVCRVEPVDGGGFVAVVVTALMRRNADTNPAATGVNYVLPYVGSTSHLFFVMCDSEGGGLPLAMIVTSDVTPSVMGPAVRLLSALSPLSPRQWLVPDVPALTAALVEQFPGARVNLALSLLLREAWLFAFRASNQVPESYQVLLYQYVVHMMGCPTDLDLVYQLQVALRSGDKSYAGFLNELHRRRGEWAVYLRDPLHRDAALATEIAVSKASVFARLHDFDTVHRVHFALTRLDKWYEHRIRAVQSGTHVDLPITQATMPPGVKVTTLSEGIKLVQGEREAVEFIVNDNVGGCSCLRGKPGWCRHQLAVSLAAKVNQLPSHVDVLRLVPHDHNQPVMVDTSRPDIFPTIADESPKLSIWGPPEVEGKRVRKVPTKLKVDLGFASKKLKADRKGKAATAETLADSVEEGHGRLTGDAVRVGIASKKWKAEKKAKVVPAETLADPDEGHGRLTGDAVRVEVVEKSTVAGKPTPTVREIGQVNRAGKKISFVAKKGAGKKKVFKRPSENRASVTGKDSENVLPGKVTKEKGEVDLVRNWLANEGLPVKKSRRQRSLDSPGSQAKTVHFSPLVAEKTLGGPEVNVYKLIKIIKRDLTECYGRNPGLREKICELYQAMTAPVTEPLSILKQSLEMETLPAEDLITAAPVVNSIAVPQVNNSVTVLPAETSSAVLPVETTSAVPPVKIEDEFPFAGFDDTTYDLANIEDIVGVVKREEVVEETLDETPDITVNQCFVSLTVLDVAKYKKSDGSYSSDIIFG